MKKSIIILFVFVFVFTIGYQGTVLAKNTAEEEKNLTFVKRFVNEGYNNGNTNVVDEFTASNYKSHWNGVLNDKVGPDVLKENIISNRESYDFKVKILDSLAKEDKVVIRWSYKGKHKKSGKEVSFTGVFIARFEKGKMVEGWQTFDSWTVSKQLGYTLTPPPETKEE
ncbi:MAG: hypothetical protein GTO45_26190 [Candidatus Aminicenantes bacterium]|nr:hypothetical protein [Candidatus Aminicenantes bacterium]NIM84500.1 hypothetical protein [Candidatus Aminicenantes bacterium]NIN23832.1 hypothetical protein [Candidatus Aminicenantes bacterium]NIN45439.1 hypothetical protein [Candidatus Aminicenantes bacterium]NIN88261.1 hypothetical protein [Candidatus Aminicenantes bacterium]